MTKLEHLIQELCPDGVEYKEIDDLSKTIAPKIKIKSKDYLEKGVYPIIDQGQNYIGGYSNNSSVFPKGQYIVFGDHTCVVKYVDFPFLQGADGVKVLQPISDKILLTKYLYYCMCNIKMAVNYSRHWSKMRKSTIPLPPIEVQAEIVRILDKFTELTTELTTELANRKKQYEYYRDNLLELNNEVEHIELREIAEFKTGSKPDIVFETKEQGNFEYINAGTTNSGYVTEYNCEGDTVTTPSRGQGGIGFVGYQSKSFWLGPLCYKIRGKDSEKINNKYLYYCLSKQRNDIISRKKEGGVPALNASDLATIAIPVPSLQIQNRIVNVLDNFESICSDLNSGLPAEIEARQKQYEYYRDKLLQFAIRN